MLYYYHNHYDLLPKGVLFLGGCFISSLIDSKHFSFEITSDSKDSKTTVLYASSIHERDQWVSMLQEVSESNAIQDDYTIHEKIGSGKFS